MRKYFVLLCLSLSSTLLLAQGTDEIMYMGKEASVRFTNDSGETQFNKPLSNKNIFVWHSPFFKNYTFWYYDENGENNSVKFEWIKDEGDPHCTTVKDKFNNYYFAWDYIKEKGSLFFMIKKKSGGLTSTIEITGLYLK